jgi:hypothetical protein
LSFTFAIRSEHLHSTLFRLTTIIQTPGYCATEKWVMICEGGMLTLYDPSHPKTRIRGQSLDFGASNDGSLECEITSDKRDYRMQLFDPLAVRYRLAIAAPALVREVQPLRGASANQPSLPAYATALTNWPPSNPISKPFFSIHTFALGARVSIPAAANACSSRIASARSISMSNPWIAPGRFRTSGHDNARRLDRVGVAIGALSFNGTALFCDVGFWGVKRTSTGGNPMLDISHLNLL